jgi:hypothetical protein
VDTLTLARYRRSKGCRQVPPAGAPACLLKSGVKTARRNAHPSLGLPGDWCPAVHAAAMNALPDQLRRRRTLRPRRGFTRRLIAGDASDGGRRLCDGELGHSRSQLQGRDPESAAPLGGARAPQPTYRACTRTRLSADRSTCRRVRKLALRELARMSDNPDDLNFSLVVLTVLLDRASAIDLDQPKPRR